MPKVRRNEFAGVGGCAALSGAPLDRGVSGNPRSHRGGLFAFEHQGCVEFERFILEKYSQESTSNSQSEIVFFRQLLIEKQ